MYSEFDNKHYYYYCNGCYFREAARQTVCHLTNEIVMIIKKVKLIPPIESPFLIFHLVHNFSRQSFELSI